MRYPLNRPKTGGMLMTQTLRAVALLWATTLPAQASQPQVLPQETTDPGTDISFNILPGPGTSAEYGQEGQTPCAARLRVRVQQMRTVGFVLAVNPRLGIIVPVNFSATSRQVWVAWEFPNTENARAICNMFPPAETVLQRVPARRAQRVLLFPDPQEIASNLDPTFAYAAPSRGLQSLQLLYLRW